MKFQEGVLGRLDRWLLVRRPHIWAVRYPSMIGIAVVVAFISALVSALVICIFDVDIGPCIAVATLGCLVVLFGWASMQASTVMPDGSRIIRSATDDATIALLTIPVAFLLCAAIYGPLFAILILESRFEEADKQVRDVVAGLQLGVEYFPHDQVETAKTLKSEHLVERYGQSPAAIHQHVERVRRSRDQAALAIDLSRFEHALDVTYTQSELVAAEVRSNGAARRHGTPACMNAVFAGGLDSLREPCGKLAMLPVYGLRSSPWSRRVALADYTDPDWLVYVALSVFLVSVWLAVSFACNIDMKADLSHAMLVAAYAIAMAFRGNAYNARLVMYSKLGLWFVFVSLLATVLLSTPSFRVISSDWLGGLTLLCIVLLIGHYLASSRELTAIAPHAAAVLVLSLLAMPYVDYVRKRALVSPE